jgi:hypothetical protein
MSFKIIIIIVSILVLKLCDDCVYWTSKQHLMTVTPPTYRKPAKISNSKTLLLNLTTAGHGSYHEKC